MIRCKDCKFYESTGECKRMKRITLKEGCVCLDDMVLSNGGSDNMLYMEGNDYSLREAGTEREIIDDNVTVLLGDNFGCPFGEPK